MFLIVLFGAGSYVKNLFHLKYLRNPLKKGSVDSQLHDPEKFSADLTEEK